MVELGYLVLPGSKVTAMDAADLSGWCPHGRPVVMRAAFGEIGKWFGRS